MLRKLLQIAIVLALIVVILGAYTRLGDAGLGCPDWPTCYGKFTVPNTLPADFTQPLDEVKAWKEVVHRYAASLLGLMIIVIFVIAFRLRCEQKQPLVLFGFLVVLVIFQGLLGMWTVTELVHPVIVTMHLLGGFATTTILFWLLKSQDPPLLIHWQKPPPNITLLVLSLVVIILQITLGGWVSSNYSALVCGVDFPKCAGFWLPQMDFNSAFQLGKLGINYEFGVLENPARVAIQMLHRLTALIVLISLITTIYQLKNQPQLHINLTIIGLLLITQITLGILNITQSLPISIATAHNATALLLLLSLINLLHKLTHTRQNINFK